MHMPVQVSLMIALQHDLLLFSDRITRHDPGLAKADGMDLRVNKKEGTLGCRMRGSCGARPVHFPLMIDLLHNLQVFSDHTTTHEEAQFTDLFTAASWLICCTICS